LNPRLVIENPLEGRGRATIDAATHEDEMRMRVWLRAALEHRRPLTDWVEDVLDRLDDRECA
jgi:hypothetical protein